MFNHNELNFNELHDKMSKKFQEKTLIINQPIHIRDIFIYSANSAQSHGEAVENSNKYKDYTTLSRLADHIESLALLGNKYHLKYNCNIKSDGTYSIKPDCLNKVTRILLHEDTLYTKTPLNLQDFSLLLDIIYDIAKKQQDNVHLLLSSMAVLTKDNQILNMVLYVQCGKEPKIHSFCKVCITEGDIRYENFPLFSEKNNDIKGFVSPDKNNKYEVETVSNNKIITITLFGGAQYTVVIDICKEHDNAYGKNLFMKLAEANNSIIPNQVDHIVTSHSVYIMENSKVAESIAHIDPYHMAIPMSDKTITITDLNQIKKNKYSQMIIDLPQYHSIKIIRTDCTPKPEPGILYLALRKLPEGYINQGKYGNIYDDKYGIVMYSQIEDPRWLTNDAAHELKKFLTNNKIDLYSYSGATKWFADNVISFGDIIREKILIDEILFISESRGFLVKNPPFGSDFRIVATEERELKGFSNQIKPFVDAKNKDVKNFIINSQLKETNIGKDYFKKEESQDVSDGKWKSV